MVAHTLIAGAASTQSVISTSEADDAVWVLANTTECPDLQPRLWPNLLGLLTRWAYIQSRGTRIVSKARGGGGIRAVLALVRSVPACPCWLECTAAA